MIITSFGHFLLSKIAILILSKADNIRQSKDIGTIWKADILFFWIGKSRNIFIFYEVTEDVFDISNVRFFKEIEKKNIGDVYTLLCLRSSVWLKEPMLFQNMCSEASRVLK